MSVLALQFQFAQDAAKLIAKAVEIGFQVTLGEAERSQLQAQANAACGAGISHSLHLERLAIDLNLFCQVNGVWKYVQDGSGHDKLGVWWKTLGSNHRWGGDFPKKDFNHYSISPDGIRG